MKIEYKEILEIMQNLPKHLNYVELSSNILKK